MWVTPHVDASVVDAGNNLEDRDNPQPTRPMPLASWAVQRSVRCGFAFLAGLRYDLLPPETVPIPLSYAFATEVGRSL